MKRDRRWPRRKRRGNEGGGEESHTVKNRESEKEERDRGMKEGREGKGERL